MSSSDGEPSSRLSSALDKLSGLRSNDESSAQPSIDPGLTIGSQHDELQEPEHDDVVHHGPADGSAVVSSIEEVTAPTPENATDDRPTAPAPAPAIPPRTVVPTPSSRPEYRPVTIATAAPVVRPAPQPTTATVPAAAPSAPATGWGDHMAPVTKPRPEQLRSAGRRPRVRKVTRVLRHIDPWSAFKIALLFSAVAYVVCLSAGVLLWQVADSTGTLANVERWFTQFGWETFEFKGGEIYHNAWIMGLFAAVALTGASVLFVTLFNLVSDIVGGVRVSVLEEEVVERTVSSTRRYVVRRPPMSAEGAATTAWDVDADDEPAPAAQPERSATPGVSPDGGDSVGATADWSVDDD